MFRCSNCGEIFDECDYERDYHSEVAEFGIMPYEEYSICPHCHSEDVDVAVKCEICGEYGEDVICEDCIADAIKLLGRYRQAIYQELQVPTRVQDDLWYEIIERME